MVFLQEQEPRQRGDPPAQGVQAEILPRFTPGQRALAAFFFTCGIANLKQNRRVFAMLLYFACAAHMTSPLAAVFRPLI
ncbi:hypothetical protein BZG29_09650 [Janthinobacterium sp. LM6]|nr:hypothetical protein BZG29_09650 [Janthinobacterium sp. LM6]